MITNTQECLLMGKRMGSGDFRWNRIKKHKSKSPGDLCGPVTMMPKLSQPSTPKAGSNRAAK